jgi:hypothetical protein
VAGKGPRGTYSGEAAEGAEGRSPRKEPKNGQEMMDPTWYSDFEGEAEAADADRGGARGVSAGVKGKAPYVSCFWLARGVSARAENAVESDDMVRVLARVRVGVGAFE